ncbi:MAG: hypothetical protein AAF566_00640 [Pseudomonadota bacterium]
MMDPIYAVRDIHGQWDVPETRLDRIQVHHGLVQGSSDADSSGFGDRIDGGSDSVGVIDRLTAGSVEPRSTRVLGNHDAMMLDCLETVDRVTWKSRPSTGGEGIFRSVAVSLRSGGHIQRAPGDALGRERIKWLRNLSLHVIRGLFLFLHAALTLAVRPERQTREHPIWIRGRFLGSNEGQGIFVVHGYTSSDEPVVRRNRICLDTGTASRGVSTASIFVGTLDPVFLHAT